MMREVVEWLLRSLGLMRVAEAARREEFENTLAMLYPNEEDREHVRQSALMIAKFGASYDDVARACQIIALGHAPFRSPDNLTDTLNRLADDVLGAPSPDAAKFSQYLRDKASEMRRDDS